MDSGDRSAVLKQIRAQGLLPVEVKDLSVDSAATGGKASAKPKKRRKVKMRDLVMFTHQMNSVLRANIPLTQALQIIANQAEVDVLRDILVEVREAIEEGSSLADALKQHPGAFPPIYVNTVRMGEHGGVLDQVMKQLADYMESSYELNSEVKSAMYYPAAIVCVAILSVTFILTAVVPKMAEMFLKSGVALPLPTQILIGMGDFVVSKGWIILLCVVVGASLFKYWLRSEEGRYKWYRILRAIPALGTFIKKVGVTRIAQTMASLLQSGVPALDALRLVSTTVNDAVVQRSLREACEKVQKGQGVAKPLAQSGVFPSLFVQMISVGEESGELEGMFTEVASAYSLDIKYAIKNFVGLMEPVIITLMALIVLFIVIALALPMMEISKLAA
jgi:type II secretory pathway component PulF